MILRIIISIAVVIAGFIIVGEAHGQDADLNYIILTMNEKNDVATVAFYIAVADSNNSGGLNFRTAILQDGRTFQSYLVGSLKDSLEIAAVVEVIKSVQLNANASDLQKRNTVDSFYINKKVSFLANLYQRYNFWGLERSGL